MSLESKPPETVLELADRILSIILDEKADLDPSRYGQAIAVVDRYVKVKEAEAYLNLLMRIKSEIPLDPVYFWQHEIRNAQEFLAQARAELEKMK